MSEVINNSQKRKELLKHLILQLHNNEAPEIVRKRLVELLRSVPYNEVVEVEQELISEGLPEEEVLRFCDIHTAVLDGSIDTSAAKVVAPGHPVDTFKRENRALEEYIEKAKALFDKGNKLKDEEVKEYLLQMKSIFNYLSDVDKHYKRKEYLLFPFLEKAGITGPPKVMWGKHDETRELLKAAHESLLAKDVSTEEVPALILLVLLPVTDAIEGMIMKEEEILLPMCLDTLTDKDWYQIYKETPQFGFSLYDPQTEWTPEAVEAGELTYKEGDAIHLSSGSFTTKELETIFKTLPVDVTFVDKDDKVKFFSHGTKKVFERNRSIIGRDVRLCHPPGSVHIVEQIINDFKSGKENVAAFWISSFMGRFVYIEYTALRGNDGEYLGVMEVTQDITDLRKLEGDQRLLSYAAR
ncbi:DUF438 domain-containing protein [Dysgonomonas termitidis]|uniref:DUF438 domain-containing protein n=1 Tax=Dysgonomonas termitidis TaxID=1516126 RepID=A0ABV9KRM0_9BACT